MANCIKLLGAILLAGMVGCTAPTTEMGIGAELYEGCENCHGAKGEGNHAARIPAIAGLDKVYVQRQLTHWRDGIRGRQYKDIQGQRMRPMAVQLRTDENIKAVSAYVGNMLPTNPKPTLAGGDPARGEALYGTCAACHQADGVGNAALNAPALNNTHDWYLAEQLRAFKSGWRGTNPKDIYGAQMYPMAQTLVDEQAILDVVAHIMTL